MGAGLGAGHRVKHLLVDMVLALVDMGIAPAQPPSHSVQTSLFGDQFFWLALKEKSSSLSQLQEIHGGTSSGRGAGSGGFLKEGVAKLSRLGAGGGVVVL